MTFIQAKRAILDGEQKAALLKCPVSWIRISKAQEKTRFAYKGELLWEINSQKNHNDDSWKEIIGSAIFKFKDNWEFENKEK